jgi:hypothetical protein
MNARFVSKVRVGLTVTAMTLCGAMAFSMVPGCASDSNGGGGGAAGSGTGGASGAGGSSAPADGDTVTFENNQAKGPMTGYGWVALGELDTLTDPTCDTDKHPITKAAACTTTTSWSDKTALCMSGTVPALPEKPVQADYDANWGVQIGVNSSEPPADKGGTTLGKTYKYLTFTVEGKPTSGLRGMVHIKGDADDKTYCATFKSGDKVTLTAFNTKCWGDATTVTLEEALITNIDKVGVQVSSGATEIKVENLCLKSLAFSN